MPDPKDAPLDADEYIIGYLSNLSTASHTEIKHFSENTGTYLSAWDCETLHYLGVVRENMHHQAYKKDCPQPLLESQAKPVKRSSFFDQFKTKKD